MGAVAVCLAALLAATVLGCDPDKPQQLGQSCGGDYGPCAKGLRCSYKKKRCYLPVDCKRLAVRVKACVPELVSLYAPKSKDQAPRKRVGVLDKIRAHLTTEVLDHCRFDAAAFKKKHNTTPPKTKSYGEDPQAKELNACLAMQGCKPFAGCFLGLARLAGPKAANPKDPKVFPLVPPRMAPDKTADGGVPADKPAVPDGMDAMQPVPDAMDAAKPARDAMTPARDSAKPAMDVMKPAPKPMAMTKPAPKARP